MTERATTSPETNVELLRATFQAFNAGDLDACMARLAPNFVINLAELSGTAEAFPRPRNRTV